HEAHRAAALTSQDAQPLPRPDEELAVGAATDRLDDVDAIAIGHRRLERGAFAVHEDVDVLAHLAALVEDPTGQTGMLTFQRAKDLRQGRTLDLYLAPPVGQLPERRTQRDHGHRHVAPSVPRALRPSGG